MRHQIAQLRHAYSQLKLGLVRNQAPFADGLISPAIAEMERAADRIEALEAALAWYADQMCEGLCQGKDPKVCANIGADNCAGCPAVVALAS